MMKRFSFLLITGLCVLLLGDFAAPAFAGSNFLFGKSSRSDEKSLYFGEQARQAKHNHPHQWDGSIWRPSDWTSQRSSNEDLIQGFYDVGVLTDQYIEDEIHILEIGPQFYRLGGHDQHRVVRAVDYVYNITMDDGGMGVFWLVDSETEEQIGTYTQYGLHLD